MVKPTVQACVLSGTECAAFELSFSQSGERVGTTSAVVIRQPASLASLTASAQARPSKVSVSASQRCCLSPFTRHCRLF